MQYSLKTSLGCGRVRVASACGLAFLLTQISNRHFSFRFAAEYEVTAMFDNVGDLKAAPRFNVRPWRWPR